MRRIKDEKAFLSTLLARANIDQAWSKEVESMVHKLESGQAKLAPSKEFLERSGKGLQGEMQSQLNMFSYVAIICFIYPAFSFLRNACLKM